MAKTRVSQKIWNWVTGTPDSPDGRAIGPDPIAKRPGARQHHHDRCMNCLTPLSGPFCFVCGQKDDDYRRPFVSLSNEVLSDAFQWDSRIVRSVIPFLFLPGVLTRAFMEGRRGVFVSPIRLYVVVSLLFFIALAFSNVAIMQFEVHGLSDVLEKALDEDAEGDAAEPETIEVPEEPAIPEIAGAAMALAPAPVAPVSEPESAGKDEAKAAAKDNAEPTGGAEPIDGDTEEPGTKEADEDGIGISVEIGEEEEQSGPSFSLENFRFRMFTRIDPSAQPSDQITQEQIDRILGRMEGEGAAYVDQVFRALNAVLADPRVINDVLNLWLPRLMVFLVPFFAFVLSMIYGRRKSMTRDVYYIDHLVFSLHFHAFLFVLMTVLVLKAEYWGDVFDGTVTAIFFLTAVFLYLFVGMKAIYAQGYTKTVLKFAFMVNFMLVFYVLILFGITSYGLYAMRYAA